MKRWSTSIENAFDLPNEDNEVLADEEHFQIYEALGIGEEFTEKITEIRNPENDEGELTGVQPNVKTALNELRDYLRNEVLNIGDFVPSERLQTAVKINTPANSGFLRVEDLKLPQEGTSRPQNEALIQNC